MMMAVLAWNNVWRNKKRSFVILAATAIGMGAGLFSVGLMTGMYDSMIVAAINREVGNIQIHTRAYKEDQLIGQFLPGADRIGRMLDTTFNVRSFTLHSIVEGMGSSATSASGVAVVGIDPQQEQTVSAVSASLKEGTYLDKKNSIVVGSKLAEKLKLKLHSRIVLSFAGVDGGLIYGAFRIGGIFSTDASTFDQTYVFIRRSDLSALLGSPAPIHEIVIRIANTMLLDRTSEALQASLPDDVLVETWRDISPDLKLLADSTDIFNIVFLGIILFALLFGMTNTLMMSVLDRIRDFGILLAIGMYRRRLFTMIILESLFLSVTGGAAGIVLGWAINDYFAIRGIDLSSVSAGLSAYGIPSMLYPYIRPSMYGILTIMIIITSVVAAVYPAVKAVRLKPVDAIRTIA